MQLKSMWRVGIGVAVLTAAAVIVMMLHQHRQAQSAESAYPPPVNSFDARDRTSQRGEQYLEAQAPPFNQVYLGPGTRVVSYQTTVHVLGGYVTSDGLLYVVTAKLDAAGVVDYWSLGLLSAGQLFPIPMPPVAGGHSGYSSIDFSEASTPESPVVSAYAYDGHNYLFLVRTQGVSALPYRVLQGSFQNGLLSTGERCFQPPGYEPNYTPYDLWAVNAYGQQRPVLTKAELLNATRGAFQELTFVSLSCHNFNGQDFIGVDSGGFDGVVYRLTNGKLTLITRGKIIASAQSRMLIRSEVDGPQGQATGYFDYLEAFARPNARRGGSLSLPLTAPKRLPH